MSSDDLSHTSPQMSFDSLILIEGSTNDTASVDLNFRKTKGNVNDTVPKRESSLIPNIRGGVSVQHIAMTAEKIAIKELRKNLDLDGKSEITDDMILRFLQFSKGDVKRASKLLDTHVNKFRPKYKTQLLGARNGGVSWKPCALLEHYLGFLPKAFCGQDKEGYPLVVVSAGLTDPRSLVQVCDMDMINEAVVYAQEKMMSRTLPLYFQGKKSHEIRHQVTMVLDMQGIGMHIATPDALRVITSYMTMSVKNYPEEFRRVFMVNCPRIFPALFALVKGLIPEKDRKLLKILGEGKETLRGLREFVDDDQIPSYLGGSSPEKVWKPCQRSAGVVPISRILAPPEHSDIKLMPGLDVTTLEWTAPLDAQRWGVELAWDVDYCVEGYFSSWHRLPSKFVVLITKCTKTGPRYRASLRLGDVLPGTTRYGVRVRARSAVTNSTGPWLSLPYFHLPSAKPRSDSAEKRRMALTLDKVVCVWPSSPLGNDVLDDDAV